MPQDLTPCARRLLIIAAVLCGTAQAQPSEVRLSGMIDLGVFRGDDRISRVGTIQRSSITFSGSEDLGSGLAATFTLSHRFDADTGHIEDEGSGKPFWQGESTVGLKGGWGSLRLGRALDVIWANDFAYDPCGNFNRIASPAWQYWHYEYASSRTSNSGHAEYGRLANGLFYDSPQFGGGFSVHFSGSFEKNNNNNDGGGGNNAGLSLNYDSGPLSLMLAHSKNGASDTVSFAGARYSFGAFTLMGAYDRSTYEAAADTVAKVVTLGASYKLERVELKAGYGRLDVGGARSNFYSLGADYALSRRTTLYVSAGKQHPSGGDKATAFGAGIAHSF